MIEKDIAGKEGYDLILKKFRDDYEARCLRCGSCCGAYDSDPCVHLLTGSDGKYCCDIYEHRFGLRRTRSGKSFKCVPIRDIIFESWSRSWKCPYVKLKKQVD